MSRFNLLTILALLLVSQSLRAADPAFKTVIHPDAIRFVQVFSDDKKACTMMFDNFVTGTEVGKGSLPSVQTKSFTYVTHPESDKDVEITQHIRGFVSTQGSGSASLVIHAAGSTTLVDLSKAIAAAKSGDKPAHEALRKSAKQKATDGGLTVGGRPAKSDEFIVQVKRTLGPGKPMQTTIGILVDRLPGDDGSGATLHIDTIDFEVFPAKAK